MVEMAELETPDWSRNFGAADGEGEGKYTLFECPLFSWSPNVVLMNQKYRCKLLLLGFGQQAATFLYCSLNQGQTSLELVGTLVLPELPLFECNFVSAKHRLTSAALVYRLIRSGKKTQTKKKKMKEQRKQSKGLEEENIKKSEENEHSKDILVVICGEILPVDRCFQWTESLFTHIEPMQVSILEGLYESAYTKSYMMEKPSPPILRSLSTDVNKKGTEVCCDPLEPSNIVNSLGASVISHCQVFRLPATLYVSVYSIHYILESIMAFESVLHNLAQLYTNLDQADIFLKKSDQQRRNLYLEWRNNCKPENSIRLSGRSDFLSHIRESDPNLRMPANIFS